jgi:hypothetical protein
MIYLLKIAFPFLENGQYDFEKMITVEIQISSKSHKLQDGQDKSDW